MNPRPPARQWDIFCKVIDNFGDIGVCWRLAADLAARGLQVRLWVDDAAALAWMAPAGQHGVVVLPWHEALTLEAADLAAQPCEVLVEGFGCEVPPAFLAACAAAPVWLNLEYLTAEAYAERSHGLPSPVMQGPGRGWTKWFFYPGFSARSGGLLREPDLAARRAGFDADAWLAAQGIAEMPGAARVSLFCYEPPALAALLAGFAEHGLEGRPVQLLVAEGRAARAVRALAPRSGAGSRLSLHYLPLLSQRGFDELLWACELNFVRGEDSVVRALWAGQPFVWQIYPQDDGAQHAKLEAFLEMLEAPASWREFHRVWNAAQAPATAAAAAPTPSAWRKTARTANERLSALPDLTGALLGFVQKNR